MIIIRASRLLVVEDLADGAAEAQSSDVFSHYVVAVVKLPDDQGAATCEGVWMNPLIEKPG
jgi:hypothetical protein